MYSIMRSVNAEDLKRAGLDLAIIGLGSPAMIKSYKRESMPPNAQLVLTTTIRDLPQPVLDIHGPDLAFAFRARYDAANSGYRSG